MLKFRKYRVVFWLVVVLCAGGTLLLLYGKGASVMKNNSGAINVSAPRPLIDSAIPARIETATFALG
jgi:hypothetical protein